VIFPGWQTPPFTVSDIAILAARFAAADDPNSRIRREIWRSWPSRLLLIDEDA